MNYSTMPTGLPTPNAISQRLPVVVRDKIADARLPMSYERMLEAAADCKRELAETESLDVAKTASDKAELYGQAAKILKDAKLASEAREIKNLAYRRMGLIVTRMEAERAESERQRLETERSARIEEFERELASTPRGQDRRRYDTVRAHLRLMRQGKCSPARDNKLLRPQPQKRLEEAGLTTAQAVKALRVSRIPESTFKSAVADGASLTQVAARGRGLGLLSTRYSHSYEWFGATGYTRVLLALKGGRPSDVAAGFTPDEAKEVRPKVRELIELLDTFEQALPK